jgi:hypothetical protein
MNIKCDSLDPIKEFCQFGIEGCPCFVISYNKTSGMIFIHRSAYKCAASVLILISYRRFINHIASLYLMKQYNE